MIRYVASVVVLSIAVTLAGPAPAQPKGREPTPSLDRVTGQAKPFIIKRAKSYYKLPDGSILDAANAERAYDVCCKSLYVLESGMKDAWGRKTSTSNQLSMREGEETKAWCAVHPTKYPLFQLWRDGSEVAITVPPGGHRVGHYHLWSIYPRSGTENQRFYFVMPSAATKLAMHEPFVVERQADAVLLKVPHSRFQDGARSAAEGWREDTSPQTFACEPDDRLFGKGKFKATALFLFPVTVEAQGVQAPRHVVVAGKSMPLYKAYRAEELRMTPEEVAEAATTDKLPLAEWTYRKAGDSYQWSSRLIDAKPAKKGPPTAAKPAEQPKAEPETKPSS